MKISEGFRLPEPSDAAIFWERTGTVAVYRKDAACWVVTGEARAYGDPRNLVTTFGNDWRLISTAALGESR